MRSSIKGIGSRMIRHDVVWKWVKATLVKGVHYLERERRKWEETRRSLPEHVIADKAIETFIPDLRIRHGIFQGMRYPQIRSVESALFPKLLGSYERELQPVLERICGQGYREIVNIGCAEGYYAVGLAMRIPGARVHAFDINPEAIRLCREMAALNQVSERVITGAFCDAAVLQGMRLAGKTLVVCDCEGYEKELFTTATVKLLAPHDVLVEVHDGVDITFSTYIRRLFEPTHRVEVIESLDDIKKARTYAYPELESYDLPTRKILVGEGRPHIMEWFFIQSRQPPAEADLPPKPELCGTGRAP